MSEATYIKKLQISNTPGSEGAVDLIGKVKYDELDPSLQEQIVDIKVKVSPADESEGMLSSKLTAGQDIELTILNPGADESLEISSQCNVKTSNTDTSPGKLDDKLTAGDNISLTLQNPGADESLEVKGLGKLKVSSADSTSDYIDEKITVGAYMQKSITGTGNDEALNLEILWGSIMHQGLGWTTEVKSNVPARMDENNFGAESGLLKPVSGPFANIIHREDIVAEGTLGTLESIGSSIAIDAADWEAIHGLYFLYVCNQNCWVNIANDATITNSGQKPVLTGNGQDIKFLRRALFAYNKNIEKWQLISYTKQRWFKRFEFGALPANIPVIVAANLPVLGYYHFDVFCTVEELDEMQNPANLELPQTLTISSMNDALVVDVSVIHAPPPASTSKVIGNSLQGSGIIYVGYQDILMRWLKINATLPNGVSQQITGGYIHLCYCGDTVNY